MAETYVRVDDRLIHGQTIVAWVPTLRVGEIIGVDDVSAANPMLKSILTMGVPKQYKTHIVTTDEAKDLLAQEGEVNRLVIVKTPHRSSRSRTRLSDASMSISATWPNVQIRTIRWLLRRGSSSSATRISRRSAT